MYLSVTELGGSTLLHKVGLLASEDVAKVIDSASYKSPKQRFSLKGNGAIYFQADIHISKSEAGSLIFLLLNAFSYY